MVQDGDKCMYACQETQCLDTTTNKCKTIGTTTNYYIEDSRKICATIGEDKCKVLMSSTTGTLCAGKCPLDNPINREGTCYKTVKEGQFN